ncbi:MAG: polyamine aminopropyltransferase [Metallosphaera yellowstonensis]|jgi:spermidine synthase|uniref:Polyamine aminopropyltransferase n=1 Tax=Metallosphaera yellowstonensis MK1 TaxID=671065 RepID=H2C6N4_9CREN|nr:polyamine aminopropyltransferase [Metallosphaera yellowstonensis]EHP69461.1 spermidine synthase [Metallosphaera yellowstonensis MK1]
MFGWSWHIEWQSPYEFHGHHIEQVVQDVVTKYQRVMVAYLSRFGKSLIIDGKVQSTVSDEYIYHETLVHPLLITLKAPRDVLILGGGEGATLREVLRHNSIKRAVMVDIDQKVVDFAKQYLKEWHQGAFDDARAEVIIDDARNYVENSQNKFDAVILDLTDPISGNSSYKLYTKEFYESIRKILRPGGGVVTQATSPSFSLETFSGIFNTFRNVFPHVSASVTYVPSFDGLWGFVYGTEESSPNLLTPAQVDDRLRDRVTVSLKFYDGETHSALFNIPKHIRDRILNETRVSTEQTPITVPA